MAVVCIALTNVKHMIRLRENAWMRALHQEIGRAIQTRHPINYASAGQVMVIQLKMAALNVRRSVPGKSVGMIAAAVLVARVLLVIILAVRMVLNAIACLNAPLMLIAGMMMAVAANVRAHVLKAAIVVSLERVHQNVLLNQ